MGSPNRWCVGMLVAAAIALSACGGSSGSSGTGGSGGSGGGASGGSQTGAVTIGVIAPFTGPAAQFGKLLGSPATRPPT